MAITPFKVIEVGTNRKPVRNFLLVITYHFGVFSAYGSNFQHFAFLSFGGLRDNVRCSSWAHWKACSGLPM